MFLTILAFILTIVVLVVIHEFGHYFAAKRFNVKVLEFGFGLPPRAWGKKIGETIWSLNWLPFGGFVRLLGEDEVDKKLLEDHRSFAAQAIWKRITIVVAGVFMNLLLAFALFYITLSAQNFKVQIPLLSDHQFTGVNQVNENLVIVAGVSENSPAKEAGLEPGERVLTINGQNLNSTQDLIDKTKDNAGEQITLEVSDPQKTSIRSVSLTPRQNPPEGEGPLGVALSPFKIATLNYETPAQKTFSGITHSYNLTAYSFEILGQTIATAFQRGDITPVSNNVAGPIGITSIVNQILSIENPLIPYLEFMAALSLNLAIINILPFPGLDGGRFFFLSLEAITRKKTHPTIEKYIHTIGLMVLLSLIFLVTISDIKKLLP